jgi:hypothetical protein
MIDEIYNSSIGAIRTYHFSNEWEKTAISFEESLTKEQTIIFFTISAICKAKPPLIR